MKVKKPYLAPEAEILVPADGKISGVAELSDEELAACMQSEAMKEARKRHRIRDGYCVRELCGEGLVVPVSRETFDRNQMAIMNPVGVFLWKRLESGQTFGDLLAALLAEYDVSREEAVMDIREFLSELDAHDYLTTMEENAK